MKIDSEELIKRIKQLDPWFCNSAEMKWEIIKIIQEMTNERTGSTEEGN